MDAQSTPFAQSPLKRKRDHAEDDLVKCNKTHDEIVKKNDHLLEKMDTVSSFSTLFDSEEIQSVDDESDFNEAKVVNPCTGTGLRWELDTDEEWIWVREQ